MIIYLCLWSIFMRSYEVPVFMQNYPWEPTLFNVNPNIKIQLYLENKYNGLMFFLWRKSDRARYLPVCYWLYWGSCATYHSMTRPLPSYHWNTSSNYTCYIHFLHSHFVTGQNMSSTIITLKCFHQSSVLDSLILLNRFVTG